MSAAVMTIREERWGIAPPASYMGPRWAARALYVWTTTSRTIPGRAVPRTTHDVQITLGPPGVEEESSGGLETERRALREWAIRVGIPRLRVQLERDLVTPDQGRDVRLVLDGYVLLANPKGSNGWIHLGVWKES